MGEAQSARRTASRITVARSGRSATTIAGSGRDTSGRTRRRRHIIGTSEHDSGRWRPAVVTVRPEYGGVFLWTVLEEGPVGLDPGILDIPPDLAGRLAAWNEEWEDGAQDEREEDVQDWVSRGRELVRELRNQLPDVRVLYFYGESDERQIDQGG
jgi:hypothetical protein